MSHDLISYAKSSAEWLRGMEAHTTYGSKDWVVDSANLAASEIDKCVDEILRLRTALATAEKERDAAGNDALERAIAVAKRECDELEARRATGFGSQAACFGANTVFRAISALKQETPNADR